MADSDKTGGRRAFSDEELQDLVEQTDSGARAPRSRAVALLIAGLALFWSLFQVWVAEPQFWFGKLPFVTILGADQVRPMHLALALALAFLCYPAGKAAPRDHVPIYDWVLAGLGAFCALYIFWFARDIAATARSGLPTQTQIWIGTIGIVILLEASRRSLGPALTVVAAIFLAYSYFGQGWLIPDLIAHQGRAFGSIVNTQWLSTEGVFGIPLGVSAAFVFLFVLFGSLLDKAGAGNYFIKMAFAGLGHLRGGPAKAAVVGSAATGLISGSSIANVVTTGTFTIPLMKRVGFTAEKAGAVEVSSSVNGQIMPPVMGAAAFLMVEFIGISYIEVITHAFIPAVISYIALVYIVHLEALKNDMPALGPSRSLLAMLLKVFVGFVIAGAVFYAAIKGVDLLRASAPGIAPWVLIGAVTALYLAALRVAAARDELEPDDPHAKEIVLPRMADVVPRGLHFLLPILVLVWYLMVERQSPAKSAFYAVLVMMIILLTQRPIKALMRGQGDLGGAFRAGFDDLIEGLIAGARNMIGIAVATGAAGIIVATVTRTPIGTELAGLVEYLSMGNLFLMLLLVGVFSLILGLGLPTTANYIVVSSLMATVVVSLGAQQGMIVPLIAAHLFVFYFGIMADVTPPVGLASFAAAAVSGGDPIKTGFTAFFYSLRTVALPFLFIYNPALILYGIDLGTAAGLLMALKVFVVATIAMLLFAAATQGYFLTRNRLWESAALLLVAFTLFVPNFWLDRLQPPYAAGPGTELEAHLTEAEPGEYLRLLVAGPDFTTGKPRQTTLVLDVDDTPPDQRLAATGLLLMPQDGRMTMEEPMPATRFSTALQSFDFYGDTPVEIVEVQYPADRMRQEVFYLPALLLLGVVIMFQRRRQTKPAF
ncbi:MULTISPECIES: TRAP transporter permease [unclassified Paracoccus (in: a-proteobacteria)]|uniref:TRAP transporter permease n=1 Tax=unclassified Paracoccus (in: a-proteobacteria) TaxID=2688777 RepID=UPI0012B1E799|nr:MULTISPECIES: TRAP transporter permease [unclassified Paracoccus (in: a-proteobacteria)]UXU76322.1 TRAP transporter permease [Paracoccus sp. SMMA_5]UXU82340.1 TRAP transporter permease [Paracoccus sp. SMMA_5_TC]